MKTSIKFLLLFSLVATVVLFSCKKDDEDTILPADEAKTEVANAINSIQGNMDGVIETEAAKAMTFMMGLEPNFGKSLQTNYAIVNPKNLINFISNPKENKLFKPSSFAKHEFFDPGTYEYNFTTNTFDLVDTHSLIVIRFPSNQAAFDAHTNNAKAELTQFVVKTYTLYDDYDQTTYEIEVPTAVKGYLDVDEVRVFSVDYSASFQYNSNQTEILPQTLALNITLTPYSFTMSFSGSGVNYATALSFKKGNDVIAEYDVTVKLTADLWDEAPEKISGHFQITPLKFKGYINMFAVEQASDQTPANVALMNENIDVSLIHVELNRTLGYIEARAFVTDWGESIEPVLVYSDGTWQKLETIFQPVVDDMDNMFSK
jgi:hypothetical protein